jgi:tetratricopeptide (TPR) repeat protein
MKKRFSLLIVVAILIVMLIGCNAKYIYTQPELEETIMDKLNLDKAEAQTLIPFTSTDKIMKLSKEAGKYVSTPRAQANAIITKIIGSNSLNVVYDQNSNLTAYEVIIQHSANCISYTNLFVAMARAMGLEAVFVDVTQQIEFGSDQFFNYQEGHICAGIKEADRLFLFDFVYNSKNYKRFRVIDDFEAIANFMTILGVSNDEKYLKTGNNEFKDRALYYHSAALTLSPKFTRAMNNLAVMYLREGNLDFAETLLKRALDIDETLNIARFNLAEIYIRRGHPNYAKKLLLQNLEIAPADPYTYHRLGQIYFSQKNLDEAERMFKRSINYKDNFLEPRLALISLMIVMERYEDAQDLIENSLEIFPGNDKINVYRDLLLRRNEPEIPISNLN